MATLQLIFLLQTAALMGYMLFFRRCEPSGQTTAPALLKMIASRDLILPPQVDYLYVEQDVQADDSPAVDAVLKADKIRWSLLEEEKALSAAIDAGEKECPLVLNLSNKNEISRGGDNYNIR
jgi:hypothetical protein